MVWLFLQLALACPYLEKHPEMHGPFRDASIASFIGSLRAESGAQYDFNRGNHEFTFGKLPIQGFKIHISFPPEKPLAVLAAVAPILVEAKASFKFPSEQSYNRYFGNPNDRQFGKLVTTYPVDFGTVLKVGSALQRAMTGFPNSVSVQGEYQLSNGIFVRYGRVYTTHESLLNNEERVRVDTEGFVVAPSGSRILNSDGKPVHLNDLLILDGYEEVRAVNLRRLIRPAIEHDAKVFKPDWLADPFQPK